MKKFLLTTTFAAFAVSAFAENIIEVASGNPDLTTFVAAVQAAGLEDDLTQMEPFTAFAPTNEAFAALPEGQLEELQKPENAQQLQAILLYHVYSINGESSKITDGETFVMAPDETTGLCIIKNAEGIELDDGSGTMTHVVQADIEADNGVIHTVDRVMEPGNDIEC